MTHVQLGTNGTLIPPIEGIIRGAQRADAGPFDSIWFPDHLMGWHPQSLWTPDITALAAFMPNPHMFSDTIAAMAVTASHSERVLIGSSVTEPIRRHPAMLAQQFLTLDHFSKGRVILGIGAGERENIEPYGLDFAKPVSRFEEALTIIRLLWENDDPVDFDGQFWQLRDAVNGMGPYEDGDTSRRYPPIWSGAHGPRMLRIVGEQCDGWLPSYWGGVAGWSDGWNKIRQSAQAAGRDSEAITGGLYTLVIIDEDESEVERLMEHPMTAAWQLVAPAEAFEALGHEHPMGSGWNGFRDYVPARLSREEALAAVDAVPVEVTASSLLCGTPDEIVAELRSFEAAGLEHAILWNVTYMADVTKLRSSYHLLSEIARSL